MEASRSAVALVLAVLACALAATLAAMPAMESPEPASRFVFRFNPPDGATWVETEHQTKLTQAGSMHRRVVEQTGRTRVTAHREKGGWRLDNQLLSVKVKTDGRDDSSSMQGLVGCTVAIHVDMTGRIKRVDGLDTLVQNLSRDMPLLAGIALQALTDTRRIEHEIREEWAQRVSAWSTIRGELGQVWLGGGTIPSATGPLPYYAANVIAGLERVHGYGCVRVRFMDQIDPSALSKISMEAAERARQQAKRPVPPDVEWLREGERVVEPATLLMHRERVHKLTRTWIEVPFFGRSAVTNEETTETICDYEKR